MIKQQSKYGNVVIIAGERTAKAFDLILYSGIRMSLPKTNKWEKYFNHDKIKMNIMMVIIINIIIFVDDTSLFANTICVIKRMIETYIQESSGHSLNINKY